MGAVTFITIASHFDSKAEYEVASVLQLQCMHTDKDWMKTKALVHWRVTFWVEIFIPFNFMSLITCLKRLKKSWGDWAHKWNLSMTHQNLGISEISPWPIRIWGMDWLFLWRHGEEHKNEPLTWVRWRVPFLPPGLAAGHHWGAGASRPHCHRLGHDHPVILHFVIKAPHERLPDDVLQPEGTGRVSKGVASGAHGACRRRHSTCLTLREDGSGNRPGHTAQHSVDSTAPQRQLIPREHALSCVKSGTHWCESCLTVFFSFY